ncbi:structural maintenance of chromosomes protein 5 isoform X2 [Alnus glutinosa]|uniref:structural maintenance of chromosomes protein 5 isoform X1 n=1 Tax=Alnus glutinosa TaxID=3517 RepID=UPI002D797F78|nr:structural maintenance of chromosomes protein 5 isoform X1 [Alnus glutinosa]XP_062174171.1 structural maintenance of chromosomes protein 5 isoform X2 [Alnus glutinosa]
MAEPRAKRPKITRGEDDYMRGNIIEIELHNFMTFNHLKCKPGSRLNLVIGPNGSGKSSLVCAIALGLGGEPQLLGRATSVGAYVKRGEESGYIKISLRGDAKEEQITIMRKIDTHNKSEWLFNGKVVPKKDVAEIIQRFNIQVNNLTQFLPQDRVCEFARLTPVQLLEETEKAVDPQLPIQHRALVEKSRELKNIELSVERNGETLNQWKALNAELEKDVERVRQREDFLAKVESMKKKLPWLKYDMKKAEYMEAKEQEKDAKKKLDEAAKTLNDLREPIEKQKQEKAALDTKCKKVTSLINENSKKRIELVASESHLGVQARGKYNEMEDLRRQEESRQQRILKAKEDLAAAELDFENLPLYEPPKDELENLSARILELEVSANQKRYQKSEKEKLLAQKKLSLRNCIDRLRDMENTHNKCLQALRKSGAEKIFEAYHWLQEHREEFNKEVYGPVLVEVNVSDRVHADYLEGHVPYYIWKSFITQDPGDRDFLVKNLRSFDVPVLNYMGNEGRATLPFQLSEEMHSLGLYSRIDQVFDAPNAVKDVLTGQFGLDHSYIGSKETDQKADNLQKLGILDCWTPENHYRWSKSRYGDHFSASVEPVHRSSLLLCSLDAGEIEGMRSRKKELEESITSFEESLKSLQTELRYLEEEAAKLHKQREEIIKISQHEKRKRRELENLIIQRRRKLESLEKGDDLDTVMAKLIDQAAKCNIQRFHCAIELKNLLVEAVSYKQRFAETHMASIEFDAKIRDLEVSLKQHEKFAMQASLNYEYCKKEVDDRRQQLSVAKRHAESIAMITPELEKEFLEMPTTIEELEAAIQDNVSQANSILFLNNNILEEYEHRKRQIEALATKLAADNEELRRCLAEVDNLKENWLPTLRKLVAQINETFSRNFQEMAVAGEVSLDEHDKDFDQFGILIKVKFRQAGQLQVLSAHHQSGGERSVSTILYLVSLQDLTDCPFRVVDEINQGMDPINERKMFQQLVRAASQPNTPQCFLLTPKLLPDLEYSEACSVLNIMNGPWIEQPSKVWSSGDCWATVTGLVGESRC